MHKTLLSAVDLRRLLLAALLLVGVWGGEAKGQDLVQAALDGLVDPVIAGDANLLLQQHPGVEMARFDVPTRNMMLHVDRACVLDLDTLNALLLPLGIRARCFVRRDAQAHPFRYIDPDACR
jgi:hypothetical protein